ncbi:hypothetical protein HPB47_003903 [Ixodes persulcatus]|uniref:Uncharacterized protein n=1 Tax=Ixodes persulcatus TaxID=34615 RepID=A0AC60PH69_IXOPE|nr:hypothetical protein HPB47_003903 [Ixodes persulcatus]
MKCQIDGMGGHSDETGAQALGAPTPLRTTTGQLLAGVQRGEGDVPSESSGVRAFGPATPTAAREPRGFVPRSAAAGAIADDTDKSRRACQSKTTRRRHTFGAAADRTIVASAAESGERMGPLGDAEAASTVAEDSDDSVKWEDFFGRAGLIGKLAFDGLALDELAVYVVRAIYWCTAYNVNLNTYAVCRP